MPTILFACILLFISPVSANFYPPSDDVCHFEEFRDLKRAPKCGHLVPEYLDRGALCYLSLDNETADLHWQILTNYTEDKSASLNEMREDSLPKQTDMFMAAKSLSRLCGESDELDKELKRLLEKAASGYLITDKGDSEKANDLKAALNEIYSYDKVCKPNGTCYRIEPDLSSKIKTSRNTEELRWLYEEYRNELTPKMKSKWLERRGLLNTWAGNFGLKSVSDSWVLDYDMSLDDYQKDLQKIMGGIKPLYEKLHAYVRFKLGQFYGTDVVRPGKPIPAHLLSELWNQKFDNVADITNPFPGVPTRDEITQKMKEDFGENVTALVEHCVNFYYLLGFEKLPDTFWTKSQFVKPKEPQQSDCHASANFFRPEDVRINMCGEVNWSTYQTLLHELGHVFYYASYFKLEYWNQDGANYGFHESIGDTIQFLGSNIPVLARQGWIDSEVLEDQELRSKMEILDLLTVASEKLAFIPNGIIFDKWVIDYDAGSIPLDQLNAHWWKLILEYQGLTTPDGSGRSEEFLDILGKYHIALSLENYSRYSLARVYQFQFLKAICLDQFNKGVPLHNCDVAGNKSATEAFRNMLSAGSSKPWKEAMKIATGQTEMDFQPVLDYFKPLEKWLDEYISKNQIQVGWETDDEDHDDENENNDAFSQSEGEASSEESRREDDSDSSILSTGSETAEDFWNLWY